MHSTSVRTARRAALASLLLLALLPSLASALPPTAPDPGAWVPDDAVTTIAHAGTTTYAGGGFNWWGTFSGEGTRMALTGGLPDPAFPKVTGGDIFAAIPDSIGGTYIGGSFTAIDGVSHDGVAHLGSGGEVLPFPVRVGGGVVRALALDVVHGTLYLGGSFTEVNDVAHDRLAAVNALTGAVSSWSGCVGSDGAGGIFDDDETVLALAVAPNGATVYAGGNFDRTGTEATQCRDPSPSGNGVDVAAFSTTTGATTAWRHDVDGPVAALAVTPDGATVYVGGQFYNVDSASRALVAAIPTATSATAPTAWDPGVAGVRVNALVLGAGGTVYAGGQLQSAGTNHLARPGVVAIGASGAAFSAFDAHVGPPPGEDYPVVHALALAGSPQRLYIGGTFSTDDVSPYNLVSANLASGTVDATFAPAPGGTVMALAGGSASLVAGGDFQSVGAQPRAGIVALDGDGRLRPGFTLSDPGFTTQVVVSPDGSTIYALGNFPGRPSGLAAFDAASGQERPFAPAIAGDVGTIALSTDGQTLYLGGAFSQVGGQPRANLAAVRTSDGSVTAWDPEADGPVEAILPDGDTVYVGGVFTHVGPGVDVRPHLAALSATTGAATAWSPAPDNVVIALALAPDRAHLYVGGYFHTIGTSPQARRSLAEVTLGTGNATPFDPEPDSEVGRILPVPDGSSVYVAGSFLKIAGSEAPGFAALVSSNGQTLGWKPEYPHVFEPTVALDSDWDTAWLGSANPGSDGRLYYRQYTSAPVAGAAPALSATPAVGVSVRCLPASWRNAPAQIATSWQLDGATIPGATADAYTPAAQDVGRALACAVTASNVAGSAVAAGAPQAIHSVPEGGGGPGGGGGPSGGGGPGGGGPGGGGSGPGLGGGAPDVTPARITGAKLAPSAFRRAQGKQGGSTLSLTLSAGARVDAAVALRTKGIKKTVKKKTTCVAAPKHKKKGQKPCVRLVAKGTLHLGALKAGTTKIKITGKVGARALAPGSYQLTLRIAGATATKVVSFTIKATAERRR